jgi:hypothetical protein
MEGLNGRDADNDLKHWAVFRNRNLALWNSKEDGCHGVLGRIMRAVADVWDRF